MKYTRNTESQTGSTWQERLDKSRENTFVGRKQELETIHEFLDDSQTKLLHIFGVAGIGKTALVYEAARRARRSGYDTCLIDANFLRTDGEALPTALRDAVEKHSGSNLLICIDGFEKLAPLYDRLRSEYLPNLPEDVEMLTAGRAPLPDTWLNAPGWAEVIETVELSPLSDASARTYLQNTDAPAETHERLIAFAGGHPLSLAVGADRAQQTSDPSEVVESADADLGMMVEETVADAPTSFHQLGLWISALAYFLPQSALEFIFSDYVLDGEKKFSRSIEVFNWLADKPYFRTNKHGIHPHETVRRLLLKNLEWRWPQGKKRLVRRLAVDYFPNQWADFALDSKGWHLCIRATHLLILVANDWLYPPSSDGEQFIADTASDDEVGHLSSHLKELYGAETGALAEYWLERDDTRACGVRRGDGEFGAFIIYNDLDCAALEYHRDTDPAITAIESEMASLADDFDDIRLLRFVVTPFELEESPKHELELRYASQCEYLVEGADADAVALIFPADFTYPADTGVAQRVFSQGDRDFRLVLYQRDADRPIEQIQNNLLQWLEVQNGGKNNGPTRLEEIKTHLRDALRHYTDGAELEGNGLLQTELVTQRVGEDTLPRDRVEVLRQLLEQMNHKLGDIGEDALRSELITKTYLDPDGIQSKIADDLNMSESTLHRRLSDAVDQLARHYWRRNNRARLKSFSFRQ